MDIKYKQLEEVLLKEIEEGFVDAIFSERKAS